MKDAVRTVPRSAVVILCKPVDLNKYTMHMSFVVKLVMDSISQTEHARYFANRPFYKQSVVGQY